MPKRGGALASFDAIDWQEFSLGYLFDHIEQGKRVKKDDQIPGKIPFVMSGVENRGVVGHISNPVATFPGNSISIDIFGNTFYRKESFGAGDDTGVYWNTTDEFSKLEMLFFSAAIGKSLRRRYSFSNKLRSSRSHDLRVKVPVKDGIIDTDVMQLLINAVQKLVIQGVNDFLMRRVACTQEVITEHANESYRATR